MVCQINIGLRVHIESNICGLGTMYEFRNVLNLAPLYYDPYLDDMATQLNQIYDYGPYLDPLLSILQARVHIMDNLARFLLLLLL